VVDIGGIMIKLPLVGPAYKMQSQSISCQNCINWYPQTIEYPNGSRVAALMPTPGLKKLFTGDVAATRCLFVLSNGALLTVIGKKLYHSKANKLDLKEIGLISALGTVRIADNGQVALIVNGTYTYALDLKKLTLTRLSGSTIPRSTHVLFLDGRFVVNKANTGQFYWSDLYSTKVNALSYATAESTPDNITAIVTFNRELWLFGAQSVERYYGTGSSNSPFSRLSGGAMAFGCLAPDSIVSLATGVIWLGVSEFGGNQIVMSGGGIPDRISTHALEEEISSFTKTSDASAYAYQIEGHVFYVISFPSANVTYCFDVSTGLWHQRSFTNAQGLHERHRSQHHAYFNNMHIVGDYRNGKLYQLDNNTFTDDGELILRERTAQAVITDKKLTRFSKLEIVCETGFGAEVIKDIPNPEPVGCDGAIPTCTMGALSYGGYYKIYVNDVEITESHRLLKEDGSRSLSTILKDDFNVVFVPLTFNLNESTDPYFNDVENGRFENRNPSYIKLRIVTIDASAINQQFEPLNGSMQLTPRPEEGASFCLSPYKSQIISCEGATNISGCIDLEGVWDLEVNGQIVLSNASPEDIKTYLENGTGIIEEGEVCCDMGYYRPVSLLDLVFEVFNGDTVYIPISLTPDGPSITTPITINATPPISGEIDWYAIGINLSEQLSEQLRPHGLDSVWNNNFKEFGIPYYLAEPDSSLILKFYILNEGNSFPPNLLRRGLPQIVCVLPS